MPIIDIDHTNSHFNIRAGFVKYFFYFGWQLFFAWLLIVFTVFVLYILADFFLKCIRKAQDNFVFCIIFTIVKNNELRQRERQQRFAVLVQFCRMDEFVVQFSGIHKFTDWHIGIVGALLFVQFHRSVQTYSFWDKDREIIFHSHVDDILYGIDRDAGKFMIACAVYCIVEWQGPVFILLSAENKAKQPWFVFSVFLTL